MNQGPIDLPEAICLIEAAVAERGRDFVYTAPNDDRCLYWHTRTNEPGCGVGVALHKGGVAPDELIEVDRRHYAVNALTLPRTMVTDAAADFFQRFQEKQDHGVPWGKSLDHAKRSVGLAL